MQEFKFKSISILFF